MKRCQDLFIQHDKHWRAVAMELGGICCGGVDAPVEDPASTAGAIITAIRKLKSSIVDQSII